MTKTKNADIVLYKDNSNGVTIITATKWHVRIWNVLTNPFFYIFAGRIRY